MWIVSAMAKGNASKIFFRDFKVYKPFVKKFETSYEELRKQN